MGLVAGCTLLGANGQCGGAALLAQPGGTSEPTDIADVEARLAKMEDRYNEMGFDLGADGMTSGQGILGALFGPSVTPAEFDGFVRLLGLNAEQADAATIVYRQRLENYQAAGGPMQTVVHKYTARMTRREAEGGDLSTTNEDQEVIATAARRVEAERWAMRLGVTEDLKALLSPAQEFRWPRLERAMRYAQMSRFEKLFSPGVHKDVTGLIERTLREVQTAKPGTGMIAAAAANVSGQVGEQPAGWAEQLATLLEEHAVAVDAIAVLILPMDEVLRTAQFAASRTPEQLEVLKKIHTMQGPLLAERFRTRNDATVRRAGEIFAASFGEPAKEKLLETYRREAFSAIYRHRHGERLLQATQIMKDLSEQQQQALDTLSSTHAISLATLRPKAAGQALEVVVAQNEMQAATDNAGRIKATERLGAIQRDDAQSQLRDNDLKLIRQVRQLLNDDQRQRLPKRPVPKIMADVEVGDEKR